MSGELLLFAVAVLIVAMFGVTIGMLVAPRIGRWAERADEDDGDRTD
jgi:hypothetical protein